MNGNSKVRITRRAILGATAALGVLPVSVHAAGTSAKLFPTGPLAANPVAKGFDATPSLMSPVTILHGADGGHRLLELTGKVRIVTLWAEWCVPCIAEMADLAALHERYGGRDFAIVAVLTASQKKLSYAAASVFLGARLGTMPLLVEPEGGMTLLQALAVQNGNPTLPCNLIIDRHGKIRGRMFGIAMLKKSTVTTEKHIMTGAEKARLMAGDQKSTWASSAADTFVKALPENIGIIDGPLV